MHRLIAFVFTLCVFPILSFGDNVDTPWHPELHKQDALVAPVRVPGPEPVQEVGCADHFSARLDFDPNFYTVLAATWAREVVKDEIFSASFVTFVNYKTIALFFNYAFVLGDFVVAPGVGTTFGPGSFGLESDLFPERSVTFLGREIVPNLFLKYRTPLLEIESYSGIWIPIQESQDTAIWLLQTRLWFVLKWNEMGIGPHAELAFTKERNGVFDLVELWVGAHLLRNFEKATFELFLGYDPIEVDLFLGGPKKKAFVFSGTFFYNF